MMRPRPIALRRGYARSERARLVEELAPRVAARLGWPTTQAEHAAAAVLAELGADLERLAWTAVLGRLRRRAAVLSACEPELAGALSETVEHFFRTLNLTPGGEAPPSTPGAGLSEG